MNVDHWLVPLPLNDAQQKAHRLCQEKLAGLLDLPLRIDCLPSETLWSNALEQTALAVNNRNPLKMYWQRNLNELRLFLKPHRDQQHKLAANIIEIHKRKRVPTTRYVKQEISQSAVVVSFTPIPSSNNYLLLLTVTGKHCILEVQIPSTENELVFRGTYRKIGEDAQQRSVTALFNCTMHVDHDMASLLSEYGLCRPMS